MVLQYFGFNKSMEDVAGEVFFPVPTDAEAIAERVGAIKDYLKDYGLDARLFTEQSYEDIRTRLQRLQPLIVGIRIPGYPFGHAWVLRGYQENDSDSPNIIFNDPWRDPGGEDPITYDFDGDGIPGENMSYVRFLQDHWEDRVVGGSNRNFIAVSYADQNFGVDLFEDWRGSTVRNAWRGVYHFTRAVKKMLQGQFIEAFFEYLMSLVGVVATVVAGVGLIGQVLEAGGKALIEIGRSLIKDGWNNLTKGGLPEIGTGITQIALGGVTILFGSIVFVVGMAFDIVGSGLGVICDAVTNGVDAVSSVFTGSSGGGTTESLGDMNLDLGLVLHVDPWAVRWGDNWEDITGSWCLSIRELSKVDELSVNWEIEVGGVNIDNWTLNRNIIESSGTIIYNDPDSPTNYHKKYKVKLTDSQGIRMGFSGRCNYGGDGWMHMVKLKVNGTAMLGGQTVTISKETSVWGFST